MKRVLILSDIHGYKDRMHRILNHETFDLAISLGDSECALEDLKEFDFIIHGNHYHDVGEAFDILKIEDFQIYLSHGHFEKVHFDDTGLIRKLIEKNCDIAFHGHTHVARVKKFSSGTLVNPGAVSHSRSEDPESYIMATFDGSKVELKFKDLTHQTLKKFNVSKGISQ